MYRINRLLLSIITRILRCKLNGILYAAAQGCIYCEFLPNKRISLLIGYYAYVEQLLLSIRMIFKDYKIM